MFMVGGSVDEAEKTTQDRFGKKSYVDIFEEWFKEPLRHLLILPIYQSSQRLGAIKVLNRLDQNSNLIPTIAPFESQEQAYCEELAKLLATDWTSGLNPSVPVEKRIMFSYSHMDMALCDFYEETLNKSIPEIAVLRDTGFRVGENLEAEIQSMINSCDLVIFLLTRAGAQSRRVQEEWIRARSKDRKVIPIVEEGIIEGALEQFRGLGDHLFIKFQMENYKSVVPEIIKTVKQYISEY